MIFLWPMIFSYFPSQKKGAPDFPVPIGGGPGPARRGDQSLDKKRPGRWRSMAKRRKNDGHG